MALAIVAEGAKKIDATKIWPIRFTEVKL
ncbi:MAG: hypothetical protein RLZZ364_838, partial [Actinomycetota bacterium]